MAANAGTLSELTTAIRCDALSMWFARIPAFAEVTGVGRLDPGLSTALKMSL